MIDIKGNVMERLEKKKIKGQYYYYYSKWGKVNGKCRRLWQTYLGKLSDIVAAVKGDESSTTYADIFSRGLPLALSNELLLANVINEIDKQCPKRKQGLTTGEYIAIAAINRACDPVSKNSIYEWFSKTTLRRLFPKGTKESLSSQRFWDHMDRIKEEDIFTIWSNIIKGVIEREKINLSSVQYDGTNFYTFIDTFNERCDIAKFGKNKQKRSDLRQVNYSLFCTDEDNIPLFFDTYDGNLNDYTQFPLIMNKFNKLYGDIFQGREQPKITAIFDKGNTSIKNLNMVDEKKIHYVTSVRPAEAKKLFTISKNSKKFSKCTSEGLERTHAYRTKQKILGKTRTVVVTFSEDLYEREMKTVTRNMNKALDELKEYETLLDERRKGIRTKGKMPSLAVVEKGCNRILNKPYLKEIITITIKKCKQGIPELRFTFDEGAFVKYSRHSLGKNILITSRDEWDTERIIKSYRSLHCAEDMFKQMKNRSTGCWWPMHHWTDSKIKVHGLYCTLALLLRAIIHRRVKQSGIEVTMDRLLKDLDGIKEVVNITTREGSKKKKHSQTVLSKLSEFQKALVEIFNLGLESQKKLG